MGTVWHSDRSALQDNWEGPPSTSHLDSSPTASPFSNRSPFTKGNVALPPLFFIFSLLSSRDNFQNGNYFKSSGMPVRVRIWQRCRVFLAPFWSKGRIMGLKGYVQRALCARVKLQVRKADQYSTSGDQEKLFILPGMV